MKQKVLIIFIHFLMITMSFAPFCIAEESKPHPLKSASEPSASSSIQSKKPVTDSSVATKKNLHLEVGGSYTDYDHNSDTWKSLDLRLVYSGFSKITPFGSVSRQTRDVGSQYIYGLGSYITVSPQFSMIAGISGAPVEDDNIILYPRLRLDLAGFFKAPLIDGLIFTTGISHFPKQNGNGLDIISLGAIYYGKVILSGSVSYNIAQPDNVTSWSGQGGIAYGAQGKYWVGGGISYGRVAYQLASTIPMDVRYESRGIYLTYSQWLGKNWGINTRIDYGEWVVNAVDIFGVTMSLFFDF
ncbi:MAG: YaiO family outer membrane beta-barrel protein [Deltaproteobacteria bacterium]|nr:YaiO family outer membrane beta-barrel protein [Deltaproteobacteria bacterium]